MKKNKRKNIKFQSKNLSLSIIVDFHLITFTSLESKNKTFTIDDWLSLPKKLLSFSVL